MSIQHLARRYVLRSETNKRVALRKLEAGLYSFKQVIQKLKSVGSYARKLNYRPESKDNQRLWDMLGKANEDPAKLFKLALRMAKSIKKTDKAVRRGAAAENLIKNDLAFDVVSQIFYARALELVGLPFKYPRFEAPSSGPQKKPKPTAPAIPSGLVPDDPDGWQLYDIAGAKGAARSLGKVMTNALKRLGQNVSTSYTIKKNVKAVEAVMKAMDKARDARMDYGASDSEPRGVVKDIMDSYLELIFDDFDDQEVFDAVDGW